MKVEKNKVVSISYELKTQGGVVVDGTSQGELFSFIQGAGFILPELEKALAGLTKGDRFSVTLDPDRAYGNRDDSLLKIVNKNVFDNFGTLSIGQQFKVDTPEGKKIVTIFDIQTDHVVVDENHPLAGETITYEGSILDIRDATAMELSKGVIERALNLKH